MRAAWLLAGSILVVGCATASPSTPSGPSAEASPPAASTPGPDAPPRPPRASIITGGSGVDGTVGAWALPTGGDSAPWLPATALEPTIAARPGEPLPIAVGSAGIDSWSAVYAPAGDPAPARPTSLGQDAAAGGVRSIGVPAPPPGDWVVMVEIVFAGGGSAAYYWHVRTVA